NIRLALRKDHAIGQLRRQIARGMGMLLADRLTCLETIPETGCQLGKNGRDAGFVAFDIDQLRQCHVNFLQAIARLWTGGSSFCTSSWRGCKSDSICKALT